VLAGVLCAPLAPASAQTWPERVWVSVSGGIETPAGGAFSDTFTIERNVETGQVSVNYPSKAATLVAGAVNVRVWKQLGVGLGLTHGTSTADAAVSASIPHPFFDNQPREIAGTTSLQRTETGLHLQLAWLVPAGRHLRLVLSGGPSYISLQQGLVTDVSYSETYPYDTATFSAATSTRASRGGVGFNVGVDTAWMFSRGVGAGVMAQLSRATVTLEGGGRRARRDAGGAQIGAGLRVVF
jgi:hypothetical protein